MADRHDHKEESNFSTGIMGLGLGLVWLLIVIYVSHLLALSIH